MIVLGIDPGTRADNPAGAALLDLGSGIDLLDWWEIKPRGEDWRERINQLAAAVESALRKYGAIQLLAYEAPHLVKNVQTLRKLAAAEGALIATAYRLGVASIDVQPAQAKVALTGNAAASKAEMIGRCRQLFRADLPSHPADAVGVGLAGEALARQARLMRG